MKYTPSILAITLLVLLDPILSAPIQADSPFLARSTLPFPPTAPHAVSLESRGQSEKRDKSYGFGAPTHFAVMVPPESRPNPCGVEGCTPSSSRRVRPRELSEEEELVQREVRKRSVEDGEFITNVQFTPE